MNSINYCYEVFIPIDHNVKDAALHGEVMDSLAGHQIKCFDTYANFKFLVEKKHCQNMHRLYDDACKETKNWHKHSILICIYKLLIILYRLITQIYR